MYRVFTGAPLKTDIDKDPSLYHWQTISSQAQSFPVRRAISATQPIVFPPATLEAASRRISLLYRNIIFDDGPDEEHAFQTNGEDKNVGQDQTTLITWPPTADETSYKRDDTVPSFLLDISKSLQAATRFETQETQETQSFNYSDASSITRFPSFHFNLHSLTPLSSLSKSSPKGSKKVNLLLAAFEVEGPDSIRIKKGADAGKEVSVLALILGDEDGAVCKLTAWREVADEWGGAGDAVRVKRGDILFIENVTATWDSSTSPALSASPHLKSKVEICFRAMPYTHEDNRLRPDLRLGESDAAVRKVANLVRWFEGIAGLYVSPT